jgi:hypothetical protein
MIIQVHYHDLADDYSVSYQHVANINYRGDAAADIDAALEYVWERCQNIEGSWSRGRVMPDDSLNEDWSPDVEVVAPLPQHLGRVYGHRSCMVGDRFVIEGVGAWKVAGCGFEKLAA